MKLQGVLIAATCCASSAAGAVILRLSPAPDDGQDTAALTPVKLTVADPDGELPAVARAVSLRRKAGGPTILQAASIAPRTAQTVTVRLPVISLQQTYVVRLLADGARSAALAEQEVPLATSRVARVELARARLIDPVAYEDWQEDLPRWPASTLRLAFLSVALGVALAGGALLIRSGPARLAAVVLAAAGATAAVWFVLGRQDPLEVRHSGPFTIVTTRRTAVWSCPAREVEPVYWSPAQMDRDGMIYRPGGELTVRIRPREVRLFRRRSAGGAVQRPGS